MVQITALQLQVAQLVAENQTLKNMRPCEPPPVLTPASPSQSPRLKGHRGSTGGTSSSL